MTHDEMITVIQAHKDGKTIEVKMKNHLDWRVTSDPWFDFRLHDYRIKPEPRSLWISFDDCGKPQLSAESAEQADHLARIEGRKFFLFQEVLP